MNDADGKVSPFRVLPRAEWAELRKDTPLTLTAAELEELHGFNDKIDLDEVVAIYLPMSRLLNLYVDATQKLFRATQKFLGGNGHKVPYIVGVGGSVAAGKTTTARILQRLLARWPDHPKVDLVTTDGFLKPNAVLERENLMNKKGFPKSYEFPAILRFLSAIKAGVGQVKAPVYSHLVYDVIPGEYIEIDRPDILIFEGINVFQMGRPPRDGKIIPNVSDYFDFSIYVDADEEALRRWYVDRFFGLRETAFKDPRSYFHRYGSLSDEEARDTANRIWETINLVNLRENIIPTRQRADLILRKGTDHIIDSVWLRKL